MRLRQAQDNIMKRIDDIQNGKQLPMQDGSVLIPPSWQRAGNQIKMQEAMSSKNAEVMAEKEKGMRETRDQVPEAIARYSRMAKDLTTLQSGKLSDVRTQAAAFGDALGLPVTRYSLDTAGGQQEFAKDARKTVFDQLKILATGAGGRILAAEIPRMESANPNPDLQPSANRALIAQASGGVQYINDFNNAWLDYKANHRFPTPDDFDKFQKDWIKAHDLQKDYIDRVQAEMPVAGDNPVSKKKGWLYVILPSNYGPKVTPEQRAYYRNGMIGRWDGEKFNIERGVE